MKRNQPIFEGPTEEEQKKWQEEEAHREEMRRAQDNFILSLLPTIGEVIPLMVQKTKLEIEFLQLQCEDIRRTWAVEDKANKPGRN